jgi:hypothetical protein
MKFEPRQKWEVEFYHGDSHRLRFREILSGQKPGKWRVVTNKKKKAKKPYWKIEPGKTSGLPKNLFAPLNEAITGSINKIFRDKRTLPALRWRTRTILINAAARTFCDCAAEEESKTLIKYILHTKPFMHFLIVNWQEHSADTYQLKDDNGNVKKNKWGKPSKDVGKLADEIRNDERTGLRKLERNSKAVLRWVVCFLADGTVWLVPAKSRKERSR